jgi:N-methylhydantoinase A
MYEGKVVGLPVQTPWVDVRSIGAGGGSIAYVDVGGLLKVGPQSAGADPGPACYGRGGTQPTVTDAAFFLGMLGEGRLASGLRLDRERARTTLEPLAHLLGLPLEDVARGVITIVNANMANAIREITVEQGQDPRQATLVAFGGAGPLFATLLARELEIRQIVVPPYAGNFSAWGLLGADLTQTAARTRIMKLSEDAVSEANGILAELFDTLAARVSGGNGPGTLRVSASREVALDMRYVGQEHTITVAVPSSSQGQIVATEGEIRDAFTREYDRTFGHVMEEQVEIVSTRATLRTPLPRRAEEHVRRSAQLDGHPQAGTRPPQLPAYSFTEGRQLPFQVVDRSTLDLDSVIAGPAIILEETATTYLDAQFEARLHPLGSLFITDLGRS